MKVFNVDGVREWCGCLVRPTLRQSKEMNYRKKTNRLLGATWSLSRSTTKRWPQRTKCHLRWNGIVFKRKSPHTHKKDDRSSSYLYIYLLVKQADYLVDCCHSLGHSYGSFVVWVVKGIHRRMMMMNTDVLINGPTHGCVSTILCSVRLCLHCFGESMGGRWKCCDSDRTRYRHVYIKHFIQSAFIVSPDAFSSPCRVRPELQGDVFEALMHVQRLSKVPRQRDIVTVNGSLRVKASSRCWAYDDDPGPYHVHSTFSALNIDEQTERKSFLNQIALLEPDVYLNVLQGCRS